MTRPKGKFIVWSFGDNRPADECHSGKRQAMVCLHRSTDSPWHPMSVDMTPRQARLAAAALVTVIILQSPGVEGPEPPAAMVTDFEILLSEDSLEMLEELEFYSWIDPQDLETDGNVG